MDLNVLTEILNDYDDTLSSASEGDSSLTTKRSQLLKKLCQTCSKAVDKIAKDEDFIRLVAGLLVISSFINKNFQKLKPAPPFIELCTKLFRQCAAAVLNVKWQVLHEENDPLKQNFIHTLENLHSQLIPLNFLKFDQIKKLSENAWTHPTLIKIMRGDTASCNQQEVQSYILNEDVIISQLRVDMMVAEGCEEYALNLCNGFLSYPNFCKDLHMRSVQLSLLYNLGHEDRLQEECQKLSVIDAVRIIKLQMGKRQQQIVSNREMCSVVIQTCLVQNWIKKSHPDCKKELLSLWIKNQSLTDKKDQFIESVWAIAKLSQSTEQIVTFIDVLREECGNHLLQLYIDMCVFALNVDKAQLEKSIKEGDETTAASRRLDIASVCVKLSCLCRHISNKIARICALTNFAVTPSVQSFNKIKTVFDKNSGCCCTICDDLQEDCESGTVNPATLMEVERLLNMFRPDYLNPDQEYAHIEELCHKYVQDTLQVLANMHKQSLKKKNVTDTSKSDEQGELFTPDYIPLSVILTQSFDAQDEGRMNLLLKITKPHSLTKAKASEPIPKAQNPKTGTAQIQITQDHTPSTMQAVQTQIANTTKSHTVMNQTVDTAEVFVTQSHATNTTEADTIQCQTANTTNAHTTHVNSVESKALNKKQVLVTRSGKKVAIPTKILTPQSQKANSSKVHTLTSQNQQMDTTQVQTTQKQSPTSTHKQMGLSKTQTTNPAKAHQTQNQTANTTNAHASTLNNSTTNGHSLAKQDQTAITAQVHALTSTNQTADSELASIKPIPTSPCQDQSASTLKVLTGNNNTTNSSQLHEPKCESKASNLKIAYLKGRSAKTSNVAEKQASKHSANLKKMVLPQSLSGRPLKVIFPETIQNPTTCHPDTTLLYASAQSKNNNPTIVTTTPTVQNTAQKMYKKISLIKPPQMSNHDPNAVIHSSSTLETPKDINTLPSKALQEAPNNFQNIILTPVAGMEPNSRYDVTLVQTPGGPAIKLQNLTLNQTSQFLNKNMKNATTKQMTSLVSDSSECAESSSLDLANLPPVTDLPNPARTLLVIPQNQGSQQLTKNLNTNPKALLFPQNPGNKLQIIPQSQADNKPATQIKTDIHVKQLLKPTSKSKNFLQTEAASIVTQAPNPMVVPHSISVRKLFQQPAFQVAVQKTQQPTASHDKISSQPESLLSHPTSHLLSVTQMQASPLKNRNKFQGSQSALSSVGNQSKLYSNPTIRQAPQLQPGVATDALCKIPSQSSNTSKEHEPRVEEEDNQESPEAQSCSVPQIQLNIKQQELQEKKLIAGMLKATLQQDYDTLSQLAESAGSEVIATVLRILKTAVPGISASTHANKEKGSIDSVPSTHTILESSLKARMRPSSQTGSTSQLRPSGAPLGSRKVSTKQQEAPVCKSRSTPQQEKHVTDNQLYAKSSLQQGQLTLINIQQSAINSMQIYQLQLLKPKERRIAPKPVLKSILNHQRTPLTDHQLHTMSSTLQGQRQTPVLQQAASNEQHQLQKEKLSFPRELSQTTSENFTDSANKSNIECATDLMRRLVHLVESPPVLSACLPEQGAVISAPAFSPITEETALKKKIEILGKSYFEDVKHLHTPVFQQSNVPLTKGNKSMSPVTGFQECQPVYSQEPVTEPVPVELSQQEEHSVMKLSACATAPVNVLPRQPLAQSEDQHNLMGFLQLSHPEDHSIAKNSQGQPQLRFIQAAACLPSVSGSSNPNQAAQLCNISSAILKSSSPPCSSVKCDEVTLKETNLGICGKEHERTQQVQELGHQVAESSLGPDSRSGSFSSSVSFSEALGSLKNFLAHKKIPAPGCHLLPDKQHSTDLAQSEHEEEENNGHLLIDLITSDSDSSLSYQDVVRASFGSSNDKIRRSKTEMAVTLPKKISEIKCSKVQSRARKRKQPTAVSTECPTKKNRSNKLPDQTGSSKIIKVVEAEQEIVDVLSISDEESTSVQPTACPSVRPTVRATVDLTVNPTDKYLPCPFCDIVFKSHNQYLQHEVSCHLNVYSTIKQADKLGFNCLLCERLFSTFQLFKEHLYIHSETIQEMVQDLVTKMQLTGTLQTS